MPATPAEIRASSFEYRAVFREPLIASWHDGGGKVAEAVFRAFREWNITLEQMSEVLFAQNFGQKSYSYQVQGRYNFRATPAGATLTITNPAWEELSQVEQIISSGTKAVSEASERAYERHELVLDIHIAPKVAVRDVTSQFLPSALRSSAEDLVACGFTYVTTSKYLYVDSSAYFPNALYLRIFLKFPADTPFAEMAKSLLGSEVGLFDILGLSVPGIN